MRKTYQFSYVVIGIFTSLYLLFLVVSTPDIPMDELKKKYTNNASKFITVDGLDVHYRQEGRGPNLLLIHGTASSLHTWDGWVEVLQGDFTITRFDLPAFGLTGAHPDRNYSIEFYTLFLDELINELGLDSVFMAGNSLGGGIAWSYALTHPQKVRKLVLLDASGYPSDDVPFVFTLAKNDVTAALLSNITPRPFIEQNIKQVYYDDAKITPALVDRYHALALASGNRQAFIDRARQPMNYDYGSLSKLKTPTLIQWGKYDTWVDVKNAYAFEKDIEYSTVIIYECGHVPMEELPERSAKDCKQFLLSK